MAMGDDCPRVMHWPDDHCSPADSLGHSPALRDSLRHEREFKDEFPPRRQSIQLFDGSKSSRSADWAVSNRIRRRGFIACRLQPVWIRAPWGFASLTKS